MGSGDRYVALNGDAPSHGTNPVVITNYAGSGSTSRTDIVWSSGVWHWKPDSLAWNCWTNAMACTNGIQGNFFSMFTYFSTPTNRNPGFWMRRFTGWPAYSVWHDWTTNRWPQNGPTASNRSWMTYQSQGVLLTPEHVWTSGHVSFPSNHWLAFMDTRNNVVFRQVKDYLYKSGRGGEPPNNLSANMPNPPFRDYYIGLLDSPVPESIGFMRVIPTNLWSWFDAPFANNATNWTWHVPLYVQNCQHRAPVMKDLTVLTCEPQSRCNPSPDFLYQLTLTQWAHPMPRPGDSGSPQCCVLDGELCLRLVFGNLDPAYAYACYNAALRELSLRNGRTNIYTLTAKDLSHFPMYRPSCVCSP